MLWTTLLKYLNVVVGGVCLLACFYPDFPSINVSFFFHEMLNNRSPLTLNEMKFFAFKPINDSTLSKFLHSSQKYNSRLCSPMTKCLETKWAWVGEWLTWLVCTVVTTVLLSLWGWSYLSYTGLSWSHLWLYHWPNQGAL